MPLAWSEQKPPNEDCHYTHVSADTPLGTLYIDWKDFPLYCCEMSSAYITTGSLQATKDAVQEEWNRFTEECIKLIG